MLFGGRDGNVPRAGHEVPRLHEMTRPCRGRRGCGRPGERCAARTLGLTRRLGARQDAAAEPR
eukprot:13938234-Heterocapsa_arctica.AAC.1